MPTSVCIHIVFFCDKVVLVLTITVPNDHHVPMTHTHTLAHDSSNNSRYNQCVHNKRFLKYIDKTSWRCVVFRVVYVLHRTLNKCSFQREMFVYFYILT